MSSKKYSQVGSKLDFTGVDVSGNGHWTIETQQTPLINNFWAFVLNFKGQIFNKDRKN